MVYAPRFERSPGKDVAKTGLYQGLMRTQNAATKLFDHVDGWQKAYSDDIATIHLRKERAVHTAEPAVDPKAK